MTYLEVEVEFMGRVKKIWFVLIFFGLNDEEKIKVGGVLCVCVGALS